MDNTTSSEVKQVIVMRNDLNMRKGKMVAQGCHASISFMSEKFGFRSKWLKYAEEASDTEGSSEIVFDDEECAWLTGAFTKVCVRAESEEELHEIYNKAKEKGLRVHIILDSGRTEFGGVPTYTCLAIGPNYSSKIDEVTGHLKLL